MANNGTTSSQFPANLPIFKGDNYDRWCAQMKVIFRFKDVLEIVTDGVEELAANADDAARTQHKELKKKDVKGTSAENTFYYCPNSPFTSDSGRS
ncbi:hypothetical protein QL285_022482 [Trifolium repens]|nr:hypothetical protein QL285_022482 [Trifolium repens]